MKVPVPVEAKVPVEIEVTFEVVVASEIFDGSSIGMLKQVDSDLSQGIRFGENHLK